MGLQREHAEIVLTQEEYERIRMSSLSTREPTERLAIRTAQESGESLANMMREMDKQRQLQGSPWSLKGTEEQWKAREMVQKAIDGKQEEHQDIRTLNQAAEVLAQVEEKRRIQGEERELRQQEAEKFHQDLDIFFASSGLDERKKKEHKQRELQMLLEENERIIRAKRREKEAEKLETLKIMESLKQKAEEAQREEEEKQCRKKEELLKLRDFQKQQHLLKLEKQTAGDLLSSRSSGVEFHGQEVSERQWRQGETERLRQRKKMEELIHAERKEQVELRLRQKALETLRDQRDFTDTLRYLKDVQGKEAEKAARQKEAALHCALQVSAQVEQRARQREEESRREREEALTTLRQLHQQVDQVSRLSRKKLAELRCEGVPEPYINDVERRVERLAKKTFQK